MLRQTFNAFLAREGLIYYYEVALSMQLGTLIGTIIGDMGRRGFAFASSNPDQTIFSPLEAQPLRLAEVVNRGRTRTSDGAVHLRPSNFDIRRTILDAMSSTTMGLPICLEESRFVLHACECYGIQNWLKL